MKLEAAGIIDRETAYEEAQRYGIISESRPFDDVVKRFENQPVEI